MANTTDVVSAIRELTTTKQLERSELIDLLKDGLHAALVKRYGPNVRAEIGIDELKGSIRIVVLKTVVETVEDPGTQVSLEEARYEDTEFEPGDVLEEEVPFDQFGRTAVQAAKQRIIQRVREGERSRIREEFSGKVGELLSGEVQQIERGKIVVMLNKFREAEAVCQAVARAGACGARLLRSRVENDSGDRGRRPAVARHRPQRPERAARL